MNQYLEIIWNISLKNQSARDYIFLCENALQISKINGYIEKHHMLPKCICENEIQKQDKDNLVIFSAKDHFIAHKLLSEMFEGMTKRKMLYALSALSFRKNGIRILDADDYAITKEASRLAKKGIPLTEEHKQKIRDSFAEHNPNKGRIHTVEMREKNRISHLGKSRPEDVKQKISKTLSGIPKPLRSDEHKENISKACKGRVGTMLGKKQPLLSCVVCRKSGGASAIKQHHFDKCKKEV
jgi:NUMOD3 motif